MKFTGINKVVLLGGGSLLGNLALHLLEQKIGVVVITSERHAKSEVRGLNAHILEDFLKKNKVPYIVSKNVSNDESVLAEIDNETLGISCGAAWIFKKDFIDLFDGKLVNLHGTRLPQERGGGGFTWRILRNERLGFCIAHEIVPGIDEGKIFKSEEYVYPSEVRIPVEYESHTVQKYIEFTKKFIDEAIKGEEFTPVNQPEYLSSYWPRLSTDIHGYIDWRWDLSDIEKFICAFDSPYQGASTFLGGKRVWLKQCCSVVNDGTFHPFQTGIIYRKNKESIFVATKQGTLVISGVFDESNNSLLDDIQIGDSFSTPMSYLEKARETRVIYTPSGLKQD